MFVSRDGQEIAQPERWSWIAYYDTGEVIRQFDEHKMEYHYLDEIDQSKAKVFSMTNGIKEIKLNIPKGSQLVHFYDNIIQHPIGGKPTRHRLYCFGHESEDQRTIYTILPNDFIVETVPEKIQVL